MIRVHSRCGTPVVYDTTTVSFAGVETGYYCSCPECDEDLFRFETYLRAVTE